MEGGGVAGPQMLAPSLAGPPGVPPPTSVPVPRFFHTPRFSTPAAPGKHVYPPRNNFQQSLQAQGITYDGKRMRNKAVLRRTVDYNTSLTNYIENRVWHRDYRDMHALQTDNLYTHCMIPPMALAEHAMNGVTTKFVRTSTNKIRCPIFCVCWTPEGRRLITGASSGEFTLWNGLTFNFETILQAHDVSVRSMIWSHNDQWMLTGDHAGFVKYWQSNMNNVKMYQSHKDPVRGLRWGCRDFTGAVKNIHKVFISVMISWCIFYVLFMICNVYTLSKIHSMIDALQ